MATNRSQAIPRDVPYLLISGLAMLVLITGTTTPASASPHPGGGRGVETGADGYAPWANTPSGRTHPRGVQPHPAKCNSDGMGGCLMPRCGDPLGTGICNAAPAAPADLAQQAWNALRLPVPDVHTAPPRGARGLVGLPEWVWVPRAQWRGLSKRASAGAAWAQVRALPKQLSIEPGAGLATVTCAGPGTAYDPSRPTSGQRTDCSYTYTKSSASQPGAAYRVRVTAVWGGTWIGSGGAGGTLPDIRRTATFDLRIAEGQGLYE